MYVNEKFAIHVIYDNGAYVQARRLQLYID